MLGLEGFHSKSKLTRLNYENTDIQCKFYSEVKNCYYPSYPTINWVSGVTISALKNRIEELYLKTDYLDRKEPTSFTITKEQLTSDKN